MSRGDGRSDEEVVAAWLAGDAAAFDVIVDRFARRVFGICARYFADRSDAEEATQETFVVLHRRGHSFRGQSAFSTWLYRVTTNVCHDLARRHARRPDTVPWDADSDDRGTPDAGRRVHDTGAEDALLAAELGQELTAALATLDAARREAVVWHDVHGLPYDEIARRQGVAVGTAKSRVHRGHAQLATALAHLRSPSRGATADEAPLASEPSGTGDPAATSDRTSP